MTTQRLRELCIHLHHYTAWKAQRHDPRDDDYLEERISFWLRVAELG